MLVKGFKKEDFVITSTEGMKKELSDPERWKEILLKSEEDDLDALEKLYRPLRSFKFEDLYGALKKEKKIDCSGVAFRERLKKLKKWGILLYETNGVTQIYPLKNLQKQINKILILRGKIIK